MILHSHQVVFQTYRYRIIASDVTYWVTRLVYFKSKCCINVIWSNRQDFFFNKWLLQTQTFCTSVLLTAESRETRTYENYSLCALHWSVETPAYCKCTASKFEKYSFYLKKKCNGNPASDNQTKNKSIARCFMFSVIQETARHEARNQSGACSVQFKWDSKPQAISHHSKHRAMSSWNISGITGVGVFAKHGINNLDQIPIKPYRPYCEPASVPV